MKDRLGEEFADVSLHNAPYDPASGFVTFKVATKAGNIGFFVVSQKPHLYMYLQFANLPHLCHTNQESFSALELTEQQVLQCITSSKIV